MTRETPLFTACLTLLGSGKEVVSSFDGQGVALSVGWTTLVRLAAARLERAGVPSPRVDAEVLGSYVAGIPRGRLIIAETPTGADIQIFEEFVERRSNREPLQHILGSVTFWRTELAVGPGVFVPRPETELLVEWTLNHLPPKPGAIIDLCSGTGAIALAIASEKTDVPVYAVEADPQAWKWLRRNTAGTRVTAINSDATADETLRNLNGQCAAVVSNPPYVPRSIVVSAEVSADPQQAVFGGDDGLDVIRPLVRRVAELLAPGGVTAIEHDDSHADSVCELLADIGFESVEPHRDLAGKPRFVTAIAP